MGAALTHQVGQIVNVVMAELIFRDLRLFPGVVIGLQDLLDPPLVAGSGRENAAHQMVAAVRMREAVQGVMRIHAEVFVGNENRSGGTEGNVASAFSHDTASDGRRGIVTCTGADPDVRRKPGHVCRFLREGSHAFPALIETGHLVFTDAADLKHRSAPALVLHIQKEHPAGI